MRGPHRSGMKSWQAVLTALHRGPDKKRTTQKRVHDSIYTAVCACRDLATEITYLVPGTNFRTATTNYRCIHTYIHAPHEVLLLLQGSTAVLLALLFAGAEASLVQLRASALIFLRVQILNTSAPPTGVRSVTATYQVLLSNYDHILARGFVTAIFVSWLFKV